MYIPILIVNNYNNIKHGFLYRHVVTLADFMKKIDKSKYIF